MKNEGHAPDLEIISMYIKIRRTTTNGKTWGVGGGESIPVI